MKPLLALSLLCLFSLSIAAQDNTKAEFFAGYSLIRTDAETVDLAAFGAPGVTATQRAATLNGFTLAISYNPASWIGIVGDFGGYYGTQQFRVQAGGSTATVGARTEVYSLLFGPQFYARGSRATVFGHALAGLAYGDQRATVAGSPISTSSTSFAFGAGGGVDVRLGPRASVRALQADVIWTRFEGLTRPNLRLSAGIVFRNGD